MARCSQERRRDEKELCTYSCVGLAAVYVGSLRKSDRFRFGCTAVAKLEQNQGARPELSSTVANFDDYDVIYLGYPIWYGDMPMAVYTFLESCDFAGKTMIPFCTHAGSGLAGTVSSIQSACSGAAVLDGLAIAGTTAQNDPEDARDAVRTWLSLS